LRIGVLGESTAAGCGVDTHEEGFPGCLAREFVARTGRPVTWEVVGQFGATSRRIRHRLLPELGGELDLAVLLAGGNDVLARRTPGEWRDDLTAIVSGLADRAEHVVVSGIPPFARFSSWGAARPPAGVRRAAADHVDRHVGTARGFLGARPVPPFGRGLSRLGRGGRGPARDRGLTRRGTAVASCR
jgi:lysophospholipase L1-like esterase